MPQACYRAVQRGVAVENVRIFKTNYLVLYIGISLKFWLFLLIYWLCCLFFF